MPVNDLKRIGNYLREKMGVVTTAQEMSVATTAGIVHFGMLGYSMEDSFLIIVSPDNPVLNKSAIDSVLERMELAKRHFHLFAPDTIHGVVVFEQFFDQALQYVADHKSITVLKMSEDSIEEVLPV